MIAIKLEPLFYVNFMRDMFGITYLQMNFFAQMQFKLIDEEH